MKHLILFGILNILLIVSCIQSSHSVDEILKHEEVEIMVLETETKILQTKKEEIQAHTRELEALLSEL